MSRFQQLLVVLAVVLIFAGQTATGKTRDPPLEDTAVITSGLCMVEVPVQNKAVVAELKEVCETKIKEIFKTLGGRIETFRFPVTVRIVSSPEQIADAAPKGLFPPVWSEAAAFPEHNLIVLALRNHLGSPISDLAEVLEHELSHLALRQALGDAKVPRWFSEGIAIHQSEKSAFQRHWLVWMAAKRNGLLPFSEIEQYPEQVGDVNLSYAQAADFLACLLNEDGWLGIRAVIRRTAAGDRFEDAIQYAFGQSLRSLEHDWRSKLVHRWQWLSLVTSTGAVWGFIVVLFLAAYIAARHRKKRKLAEMQTEEETLDRAIATIDALAASKLPSSPKSTSLQRIPTKIRVDDDIHTLH